MDLDLELSRVRGRAKRKIAAEVVRDLTQADLAMLETERGVQPRELTRLRERHHALARALASGLSEGEAAAVTGYDLSRISVLKGDPAFKELLAFYRENVNASYAEMHELLAGMSKDAALILRERLEDEPEDFGHGQLLEIAKMGADRTGHGPSSTSTQVNVHVDMAERLERARERVAKAKTIEHREAVSVCTQPPDAEAPVRASVPTHSSPSEPETPSKEEDE